MQSFAAQASYRKRRFFRVASAVMFEYLAHLGRAIWRYRRPVASRQRAHTPAGDRSEGPSEPNNSINVSHLPRSTTAQNTQQLANLTKQLANLTNAEPVFLRLPGVLPSVEVKQTLLDHDVHARRP